MIDAVNLIFFRHLQELLVQRFGTFEVVTKRLFDDDAAPVAIFLHQSRGGKILHDRTEEVGRGRQIIEMVAVRGVIFVDLVELLFQLCIDVLVVEVAGHVVEPLAEPLPQISVDRLGGELLDVRRHFLAKVIIGHR